MRANIVMQCTECKEWNYLTKKNKKTNPERIELKKYCSKCRATTLHKEKK